MKAIVSEKGQVTIPQELRNLLGLKPGQVLNFEAKDGLLIARKEVSLGELESVVGMLSEKLPDVDEYLEETRGPSPKKPR